MNDETKATFLPWDDSEPNGGLDENHVRVGYPSILYKDLAAGWPGVCSSCLLDRSMFLRLDGRCDDSYIGDSINVPISCMTGKYSLSQGDFEGLSLYFTVHFDLSRNYWNRLFLKIMLPVLNSGEFIWDVGSSSRLTPGLPE